MGVEAADGTGPENFERFRSLYARTQARIFAFAVRRTRSIEDAADAFSETYLVAWRKLDQVPDGDESILWLYTTCRLELANHSRRMRRRSEMLTEIGADLEDAFFAEPDASIGSALSAREVLWKLPDSDREILMLAAWEGLDSHEIGKVLGCSAAAARIRLHRARKLLSEEMRRVDLLSANRLNSHRETPRAAPAIRETQGEA